MANIGYQQTRKDGSIEPPLVTIGDDLNTVAQFLAPGRTSYNAADVVASLLSLSGDFEAAPAVEAATADEPVLAHA
jgi:nitronate monooxygenase